MRDHSPPPPTRTEPCNQVCALPLVGSFGFLRGGGGGGGVMGYYLWGMEGVGVKWTKARGVDMKVAEGGVEVGRGFVLFGKSILA